MLIEQAFFNLPEILVGAGYAEQDYEAGIVSAFSLAILQELNGRNAANPISYLKAEQRFLTANEKLRADLHVRLARLYSGSKKYAKFGFRFSNWIEAKFFRPTKGTPPSTQNLGAVVADLVRLVALVPIEETRTDGRPTGLTFTGRFFLHIYLGDPLKHLNPNRKDNTVRGWVSKLLAPGAQTVDTFELDRETKSFFDHLGLGLKTATCNMTMTNFVMKQQPDAEVGYTLVLSRL